MERNASLRLQIAAAAKLTARKENQLATVATLLLGRTAQRYHLRCCSGQHGPFEVRHATRQVSCLYTYVYTYTHININT